MLTRWSLIIDCGKTLPLIFNIHSFIYFLPLPIVIYSQLFICWFVFSICMRITQKQPNKIPLYLVGRTKCGPEKNL